VEDQEPEEEEEMNVEYKPGPDFKKTAVEWRVKAIKRWVGLIAVNAAFIMLALTIAVSVSYWGTRAIELGCVAILGCNVRMAWRSLIKLLATIEDIANDRYPRSL
jgi:hypothetical protein